MDLLKSPVDVNDADARTARLQADRSDAQTGAAHAPVKRSDARLPCYLYICRADGSREYVGSEFWQFTGLKPGEVGEDGLNAVHADDRGRVREHIRACLAAKRSFSDQYRFRKADGTYRWFVDCCSPRFDATGDLIAWYGACTDFEDEHRACQVLRQARGNLDHMARERRGQTDAKNGDAAKPLETPALEEEYPGIVGPDSRAILRTLVDVYCLLERDGVIRRYENGTISFFPPGEVLNRRIQELVPAAIGKQIDVALRLLAEGAEFTELEFRLFVNDDERWFEARITPLTDATLFFFARDVTKSKRAEESFRQVVEWTSTGMILINRDGAICMFNSQAERQFGYGRGELIGRPIEVLIPERFHATHPGQRENYFGNPSVRGMSEVTRLVGLRKDGTEFPVEIGLNPLPGRDGGLVLASIIDITERKQSEAELSARAEALANSNAELRRAEQQFRQVVEWAPIGMILVDRDGCIKLINARAEVEFGYSREELIGRKVELLMPERSRRVHPELRENYVANPIARSMGIGRDLMGLRKDGTEFPVEVGLNPLPGKEGGFILASVIDITERKLSAATAAARAEELARSNAELQQFAYVASHDLQEPLRMVASYVELLAKRYHGQFDERAQRYMAYAVDGATRMQALIEDLLTYSRVASQPMPTASTECDDALKEALANLGPRISATKAVVTCDPLPAVYADPVQLVQLFQNLIGNALKFCRDQPRIHVSAELSADDWRFTVRDNGIGIAPEHCERIFQIFQRLHSRSVYPGTGIGLAICKKVVERHGGRIGVAPAPGGGSEFSFTLPVKGPDRHDHATDTPDG